MNDWHYFFHHVPHNLESGTYRIFEPQCKAEILHWFETEDVEISQKEEFIKALVDFDDSCGDFYRYRAYFLAMEALAHFKDCSLGDALVGQLLKYSYAYFQEKQKWQKFPAPLVKTAREALKVTDTERVITAFENFLHTTESRGTLREAALQLWRLDPGNKTAHAALVLLMQVTQDADTLYRIIPSLGKIGSGDETAIAILIHLMQTTLNKDICRNAVMALGRAGYDNKDAQTALVEFLQTNQGDEICFNAALALSQIDPGNAVAIDSLVYILQTSRNIALLNNTAQNLVRIAPGNMAAIDALSQIMETTENEHIHFRIALCLVKFDPTNVAAIAILSKVLETTENEGYRWQAVCSLVEADPTHELAPNTLLELVQILERSPKDVCCYSHLYDWGVIQILEKIDPSHQLAIDALMHLIRTAQSNYRCLKLAVQDLKRLGVGNEAVIPALVELLSSTQNVFVLCEAARLLGEMGAVDETAIATILHFAQTFQEEDDDINELDFASSPMYYESCLMDVADSLREILHREQMPAVVTALKNYLGEPLFSKSSSYRYDAVLNIVWHCAQNLTYQDFYNAWHKSI